MVCICKKEDQVQKSLPSVKLIILDMHELTGSGPVSKTAVGERKGSWNVIVLARHGCRMLLFELDSVMIDLHHSLKGGIGSSGTR